MKGPVGRTVATAAAAALLGGCFTYVTEAPGTVAPGEDVRVHVSRSALEALPEGVSAYGAQLEGTLVSDGEDGITVRVPMRRPIENAFSGPAPVTEVRVAGTDILQIERKTLDVKNTALLVGGAAGVAAIALNAFVFGGSGDGGREEPNPELIRIPLFSLPGG